MAGPKWPQNGFLDSYEPEAAFRTIIAQRFAQTSEDARRSCPWSVTVPVSQLLSIDISGHFQTYCLVFLSFYPKSIRLVLFFF